MTREVQRRPVGTDIADLMVVLQSDGAVIVESLVNSDQVAAMRDELTPHIERRNPGHGNDATAAFWGRNTKRFQGLHVKSPTYVNAIITNPVLLGIADALLGPHTGDYWVSQTELIFIGPGEPAQELHRDDVNWEPATRLGIDVQFSVLVSVGDYDPEVGATLVIPGSHLTPRDEPINARAAIPIDLAVGDALVYLGSVVHGGGHNSTTDRWREALYCGFLLGWLTPEEATALAMTPSDAESMSERARQLLGWSAQRGVTGTSEVEQAMALWQLDDDDAHRYRGLFRNP